MELNSLNDKLYDEFFVQQLESRLETDPLMVGGLLDLFDSQSASSDVCVWYCESDGSCHEDCVIYW
jgi:hypothetical protein